MTKTILGARIRERRRGLGITQAELARRVGVSPSYLNLIEHNKRSIAGALLRQIAHALALRLDELDGAAERRLLEILDEIAHAPEVAPLEVETDHAGELIGRFPGWARALAALARSEREATDIARSLADRLTHDPFLGDTVHRMLSQIAAVRSAAEILVDYPDLETARRSRFHEIVHEESRRLSDVGEALAAYFDKADEASRILTPHDEVEYLFDMRRNHFEEIESAAATLAPQASDLAPGPRQQKARALAETELGGDIDRIISGQPRVETRLARAHARAALLAYATGAVLAPMDAFEPRALAVRFDVERLADAFRIDFETVCHRLSALPVRNDLPQFGYFQANAAGTIVQTRNLPVLGTPRYGAACPLWVLYRAQQTPDTLVRQRTLFPSGARFVFLARAHNLSPPGFGQPRHYVTDMLAMSETDAMHTAYAPDRAVPVEPVGSSCRSCARRDCIHRVADPLAGGP